MNSNIVQILRQKKFSLCKLSKKNNNFLMKNGYLLLKPKKKYWQWIEANPREIRTIIDRLIRKEGFKAGSEGKEKFTYKRNKKIEENATRLGNLLDKHPVFRKIATLFRIELECFLQPRLGLHVLRFWNSRRAEVDGAVV